MRTLFDLEKNSNATIRRLHADEDLKARFISLGITRGTTIKVLECAPAKQTMQIEVGSTKLALRESEAKKIEIDE